MDYIKQILGKDKFKSEKWINENLPTFFYYIDNLSIGISWKEKLYLHINSIQTTPNCYCGNKVKFISVSKGYRKYCSTSCLSNDPSIKEKRKKTCIDKYKVDNPMKSSSVREKYKNSIIEKYNVDNISILDTTKQKVKNTNLSKFGVEYISQREDVKLNLSKRMSEKSKDLNLKRKENIILYLKNKLNDYNIEFITIIDTSLYKLKCQNNHEFEIHKNTLNDRTNNKNTICTVCNPINNESDSQNQLYDFISGIYKGDIIKNDRLLIGMELDIYLPELKIAFEFNGVYWHSDKYKDKNYHLNKTNLCLNKDIHLIHIWEDDWKYKKSIIESRINNLLGKYNRIWARLCEVKEVSYNDTKLFLDQNHIQGSVISKYNIGLYYKNELVSIMTFGSLRKSLGQNKKDGQYELLRFCNKLNFSIIGGASKLFKYFKNKYNPLLVISYADRCWSNGNLYKRLGFKMDGVTQPNYYYVINGIRKNRFNYRKDVLVKEGFDSKKTEFEIMSERGIDKIYDSGNIRFIYSL